MDSTQVFTKQFGNTGREVTCVGLGGEGVLRTFGRAQEAQEVIKSAVDRKINYFDSARVYSDSEVYYGSVWGSEPEVRKRIFQTSKSASRDKKGAQADLEESLERLRTDYLDLWQIHDVRTDADIEAITAKGGALEAFEEARQSGKVKAIGVTGHHDPRILTQAVRQWPVDSVMIPVNPVEGVFAREKSETFLSTTLAAAKEKGIAVIGMKILGASHYIHPDAGITASLLIRYALSHDITVGIVGCSTPEHVETLIKEGLERKTFSDEEKEKIENAFAPYAERLAYYRGVL